MVKIFESELTDKGQLVFGKRDPKTGKREERFSPFTVPQPSGGVAGKVSAEKGIDSPGVADVGVVKAAGAKQPGPTTIDTKVEKPDFLTELPGEEETLRQEDLKSTIDELSRQSVEEIKQIRAKGKRVLGATTGFLAKAGALGRTISGAPIETNLGVLSDQNNQIELAVKEEQANLADAISKAKTGSAKAAQDRVDELNKLMQTNFDNALKLIEEDRKIGAEERANFLADIQGQKLQFDITKANNELTRKNAEDALDTITLMAESNTPIDSISVELMEQLEDTAGLPKGIFADLFVAKQDAAKIATAENQAKVDKIEQDIKNSIEQIEIDRRKADISAFSAATSRKTEERLAKEGKPPKTIDVRKSFRADVNAGADLGESLTELENAGIDPFSKDFIDITADAIRSQIQRDVSAGLLESEIEDKLITAGLLQEELEDFRDEISKAPKTQITKSLFGQSGLGQ